MWLEWDITSWKKSDTQLKSSWLFKNKVFWWGMFYLTIFKLILLKYETQFALESTLFRTNQKSNCKWFHYMRKKIKYGSKLLLRDKDSKLSTIMSIFYSFDKAFFFFTWHTMFWWLFIQLFYFMLPRETYYTWHELWFVAINWGEKMQMSHTQKQFTHTVYQLTDSFKFLVICSSVR